MRWYKFALRKHLLRMDPRVIVNSTYDDPNLGTLLSSFFSSAILKGLDVIGLVNYDPRVSIMAAELAKTNKIDLFVLPGQIYKTSDGYDLIIYNKPDSYRPGMSLIDVLKDAKNNNFPTLVYGLGKKRAKYLHTLGEDGLKPTFVEIFSTKSYGYMYLQTNTYEVVSSAAESPSELELTNIYAHVPRKDLESLGVMPEGAGEQYVPPYLSNQGVN